MPVGQKLRELRIKRGLTQSELADGIVTPSMISLIEADRANPSEKVLRALADKLGVSMSTIEMQDASEWEQSSVLLLAYSFLLSQRVEAAIQLLHKNPPESAVTARQHNLLLAECYIQTAEFGLARTLLEQLEEQWQNDKLSLFYIYSKIGKMYTQQNNSEIAAHYWIKAYQIGLSESSVQFVDVMDCVTQISRFYLEEDRIEDLSEILRSFQTKWNLPAAVEQLAEIYLQSALKARDEKRFQFSTTMAHQALTLFRSIELLRGSSHLSLYQSITDGADRSAEQARSFESLLREADFLTLAKYYLRQQKLDLALTYAKKSLQSATSVRQQILSLRTLANVQEQLADRSSAMESVRQLIALWEQQGNAEQVAKCQRRLTELQLDFSAGK